jgi:cell wall-associated NlpC family hydrolase
MKACVAVAGVALALAACTTTRPLNPGAGAPRELPGGSAVRNPQASIVDAATAMLGQPYRYGGAAPGGFDCSGLVVYATGSAGIHLPRTALEQLHAGSPIPRSKLRAGDLVFMNLARKELHVGIAIDDNRFVHAPATGRRVRIDSLNASPYARAFLTARRIVADAPSASAIQSAPTALPAN